MPHRFPVRLVGCLVGCTVLLAACDTAEVEEGGRYTEEELSYFAEIAFGSEFGGGSPVVHKWVRDVDVRLAGAYTRADSLELAKVLAELTVLTGRSVGLTTSLSAPFTVTYTSRDSMRVVVPQYVPGNDGFVYINWGAGNGLTRAAVVIDRAVPELFRRHLVREEVTQGFGLLQDSYRYPDSIFQQEYTSVTTYAPIDRKVIEMLYHDEVRVGMSRETALQALRRVP